MSNKNSSNEKTTKDGNEEKLNESKNDFNLKNLKEYETIKIVNNKDNPEKENKTLQIKKNNMNRKKSMLNFNKMDIWKNIIIVIVQKNLQQMDKQYLYIFHFINILYLF